MADKPLKSLTFPGLSDTYTIPEKTSDLTNDSGFVNAAGAASAAPVQSVNGSTGAVTVSVPSASSATPQALGTAAAGSSTDYSRADHVHAKPSASDVGAIAAPSNPSSGQFLVYDGTDWVAQTLATWSGGSY